MWPTIPPGTSITGGTAGPSDSKLTGGASSFDASDWTVSTGSSKATGGLEPTPLMLAGAALLVLLIVWRLTKKS